MSQDADIDAAPRESRAKPDMAARFARLAHKELREVLRDRRTIITLVLMPLLLYPLLGISSRQFLLANLVTSGPITYRLGVASDRDARTLARCMALAWRDRNPGGVEQEVSVTLQRDLEAAVAAGDVDVGVRFAPASETTRPSDMAVDCELLFVQSSPMSTRVLGYVESQLQLANHNFMADMLRKLRVSQRADPIAAARKAVEPPAMGGSARSLAGLVPLILILMTITGAVYPAIDLTAGERERGTLEVLVAAPAPRLALLLAKYVAVLTVSCLTAAVNLGMMTLTGRLSGLGPLVFGEEGLPLVVVAQVACLMILFAAFFSAVLLCVSSFARSFKEAQAYLIPLMMAAIAPGLVSLMPEVKLSGWTSVAPLLNIVLLARDLFNQTADPMAAAVVVVSTLLYALAAVSLAARMFGAEAVLYSADVGWRGLWNERGPAADTATIPAALFCLALLFPCQFIAAGTISQWKSLGIGAKLALAAVATAAIYVAIPALAARGSHVRLRSAFRLRPCPWGAVAGAVLLGLSLWPWAHELVLWQNAIGLATLSHEQLARAAEMVDKLKDVPWWLVILTTGVAVSAAEELFFRGYLFSALLAGRGRGAAIGYAGLLFGAFHLVTSDALAIERFLPSSLLGMALGWVAWRAGAVWPSIAMHVTHNSLVLSLVQWSDTLKRAGIGVEEQEHLPATWLAVSTVAALAGAAIVFITTTRVHARGESSN